MWCKYIIISQAKLKFNQGGCIALHENNIILLYIIVFETLLTRHIFPHAKICDLIAKQVHIPA